MHKLTRLLGALLLTLAALVVPSGTVQAQTWGSSTTNGQGTDIVPFLQPDAQGLIQYGKPAPVVASPFAAKQVWLERHGDALLPPGVNNPNCRVSAAHPEIIFLVHGTDSTLFGDFGQLGPQLAAAGWCVYGIDYGQDEPGGAFGQADVWQSAGQIYQALTAALQTSGAQKAQIIGFSQGSALARYVTNKLDQGKNITRFIGLANPARGGRMWGAASLLKVIPEPVAMEITNTALVQLAAGSKFFTELNQPGETIPGVQYLTLGTRFDEFLAADEQPLAGGRHAFIQEFCATDLGEHLWLPYSGVTARFVTTAVAGGDPWAADYRDVCGQIPLGHDIFRTAALDNLRKIGVYQVFRQPVVYKFKN